ncbi:MAG: cyanophycinase [Sporomusaceae bacterium]|nr:cyanophycinase [Sporomusaceae bacterium]
MGEKVAGNLMIIGGNEDKEDSCVILKEFLRMAQGRESRIVIVTTASEYPRELGEEYRTLFLSLGAKESSILYINNRETANGSPLAEMILEATGIFFTGGDQLRLTSILGGSEVESAIRRAYRRGVVIAGTSAGASVMSDTMIVEGEANESAQKEAMTMAHGMGLLAEVVIDQHFAQRGRMNRLLSAVAQNPFVLGVGIDEDTALVVADNAKCRVIGSKTVTIVDGKQILHTNISESNPLDPLAITNLRVHILPSGFGFDLKNRVPYLVNS